MPKKVSADQDPKQSLDSLIRQTLEDLYRRRAELRHTIPALEQQLVAQCAKREPKKDKAEAKRK